MKRIIITLIAYTFVSAPLQAMERPQKPTLAKEEDPFEGTSLSANEKILFAASASGDLKTAKTLLVKETVSANIRDKAGNTPLHYAAGLPMAMVLVNNGADINAQNDDGLAPLHIHTVLGHLPIIDYLLGKGAKANIADNNKVTPLMLATMISYFENPEKAVAAGTALTIPVGGAAVVGGIAGYRAIKAAQMVFGFRNYALAASPAVGGASTAIATAAAIAYVIAEVDIATRNSIVKNLIVAGKADPNAQDTDGNTPLHYLASGPVLQPANRHGGLIMAENLMARGADKKIENNDGQTPYDIAVENNRTNLLPILATQAKGLAKDIGTTVKAKAKKAQAKVQEAKKRFER